MESSTEAYENVARTSWESSDGRRWRVGDLVTASRMRHYLGNLLLCRIGAIFGSKAFLLPVEKEDLPRSVPLEQLTLVEAWTGIAMLSCKKDGSVEHLPGDFPHLIREVQ